MFLPRFLFIIALLSGPLSDASEAVFGVDGKRVWITLSSDSVGYLDIDDREPTTEADRQLLLTRDGVGPKNVIGIAMSKAGNLLLGAPDAVWAFNPQTEKIVQVAAMPPGFGIGDIAYQETTGAIFVSGWFTRADHTVERAGAFRIAKGSAEPEPVLIAGIESIRALAFTKKGQLFVGAGPDLWAGDLVPTEHEAAGEYPWQFRGFRIAALGTPISGEGSDANQMIASIAPNGDRLVITMQGAEGSTILALPTPPLPRSKEGMVDRVLSLKARWAFQQRMIGALQFLTPPDTLPRLPLVAASTDGTRVVYQTAGAGVRRWWLVEKAGKPRLIREESD